MSYKNANKILLGITIYCLLFPLFSGLFSGIAPWIFPKCLSIAIFNKPCPLCGLTRGIGEIVIHGNISSAGAYNILSMPVFIVLLCEFAYRIFASFHEFSPKNIEKITRMDLRLHIAMLCLYLVYSLTFTAKLWF